MGKAKAKGGGGGPGGKFFQGKETFQRMNYLYQAAHVVLAQSNLSGDIPAYYGHSMFSVAQKSVLKIEPNVKRDLCKGCGNVLKPGLTVKNRIRSGKLIMTCLRCGTIKRFPLKKGYKLWIEKAEALLEVIEVPSCPSTSVNLSNEKSREVPLSESCPSTSVNLSSEKSREVPLSESCPSTSVNLSSEKSREVPLSESN